MESSFSIFTTRRFWIGLLALALIQGAIFYALRNADMGWLIPPVAKSAPQWPDDLPLVSSGTAADGTPYVIVPTRRLTAQELAQWQEQHSSTPAKK